MEDRDATDGPASPMFTLEGVFQGGLGEQELAGASQPSPRKLGNTLWWKYTTVRILRLSL